jgi:hypothetical protein
MGADAFVVFYGTRYEVGDADEADALDHHNDPRLAAAKRGKLDTYGGRLTDGEPHFLFIGRLLGVFGVEGETLKSYSADELAKIADQTRDAMAALGLPGQPQFWFQLYAQY